MNSKHNAADGTANGVDFEPFVPPEKVGEFLGLSRRHVLALARSGELPAHPIADGKRRTWRFRLSEIVFHIENRDRKANIFTATSRRPEKGTQ